MKLTSSGGLKNNFKPIKVNTFEQIIKVATSGKNWSCGIFENGIRNLENFKGSHFIALDIDNDEDNEHKMGIDKAVNIFSSYKNIILPSKSHRKEKKNSEGIVKHKAADRFRVILFLEEKIENAKDYRATFESLRKKYPAIDAKCSDASRMWYSSPEAYSLNKEGKKVKVIKYVEPKVDVCDLDKALNSKEYGELSKTTLKFLSFGAKDGEFNYHLTKACIDIREQGYSKEQAISMLKRPTGYLDYADLNAITSIYNKGEMRYDKREGKKSAFNFETIQDIIDQDIDVNYFVEGLMFESGISIMAAEPKAGKSTLTRQLAVAIAQGGKFLDRQCTQGSVLYLALEEHKGMVKRQFESVGYRKGDPLFLHVGAPIEYTQRYEDLAEAIDIKKPKLVVIDTMHLFTGIENLNDYVLVNKELTKLREIARKSNAHILLIHHQNKPVNGMASRSRGGNSISGSNAIFSAVDCAIIINKVGKDRYITTQQRGGQSFFSRLMLFDFETQTYTLGSEDE